METSHRQARTSARESGSRHRATTGRHLGTRIIVLLIIPGEMAIAHLACVSRDAGAGSDPVRLPDGMRDAGRLPRRFSHRFPRSRTGSTGGSQAALAGPRLVRLLFVECVDERLRLQFPGHDCQTARFANLAGLKNGCLLMLPKTLPCC